MSPSKRRVESFSRLVTRYLDGQAVYTRENDPRVESLVINDGHGGRYHKLVRHGIICSWFIVYPGGDGPYNIYVSVETSAEEEIERQLGEMGWTSSGVLDGYRCWQRPLHVSGSGQE